MKLLQPTVISTDTTDTREILEALIAETRLLKDPAAKALADTYSEKAKAESEENLDELLDELEGELQHQFCPDYTYFGMAEGDGACYGLWADIERVSEDRQFGDLPDYQEVSDDYNGLAVDVTDHGNVSLLLVKGTETTNLWSVV
jgi:hypothetical protein